MATLRPSRAAHGQLSLLGHGEVPDIDPAFTDVERIALDDGAWLDLVRGWLRGHAAVFDRLYERVPWRHDARVMYEKTVEVPRGHAVVTDAGSIHPVLVRMRDALDARYRASFERLSLGLYRDGRDSVAWHGDYVARRLPEALVATVSVGAPRKFMIRKTGGGSSTSLSLGWGDLLVMGGTCQRTHQHAIPKVAQADPRIAIMYRPRWVDPAARAPDPYG